jgi:hypothetical protein
VKDNRPALEPKTTPQAIRVRSVTFAGPQDGPGFGVKSALSPSDKRHTIEYLPVMRHFRITWRPDEGKALVGYIPECRVMYWLPAEP